jgi:hypothetical protein
MSYGPCEYCGPTCYQGAAHHARVEDNARFDAEPSSTSGETRCKCGHEKKWHGETGTCCFVLGGEPHWCVCDKFMPVETEICEGCEQPSNELRVSGDDVELCPECMNLDDIPATQREEASRDTQRRKGSMCIHCGRQTAHICPAFSGPSLPTEAAPELRHQLRNWHHVTCSNFGGGACTCLAAREALIAELAR